ncbi:MAG: ribonuclease HII [Patescibacteria group bacterium]|nr:ribonuclease HII [Patescibacteria group bacterium]
MNFRHEHKLWKQGYDLIVGLDEAGRGSWAGPLVAGAVVWPRGFKKVDGLNDSKKLTPSAREKLFLQIVKNCLGWAVGIVPHTHLDEVGVLEANREVFRRALENLGLTPHYVLVDGVKIFEPAVPHEFIIRGDGKIASIAAASIVAKVVRDRMLAQFSKDYPEYNWHNNKGYGTEEHRAALDQFGLSELHRLSFLPMREIC